MPLLRSTNTVTIHFHSSRAFSTTRTQHASILFALHALSNSRETQHFNKISRLSRIEHSPPLQLIKTSEVDTSPCPTPLNTPPSTATLLKVRESARGVLDEKALRIGRLILSEHARSLSRSQRALDSVKRQQVQAKEVSGRERIEWEKERARLQRELRSAGGVIIGAVAVATALATWRFWPETASIGRPSVLEPRALGTPYTSPVRDVGVQTIPESVVALVAPLGTVKALESPPAAMSTTDLLPKITATSQRSWRSLLWKQ